MEIKSDTIIDLVAGQGRIEQAILDMGKRLDVALPALHKDTKELEVRVGKVENKQWYMAGVSTAIGTAIGTLGMWLKK